MLLLLLRTFSLSAIVDLHDCKHVPETHMAQPKLPTSQINLKLRWKGRRPSLIIFSLFLLLGTMGPTSSLKMIFIFFWVKEKMILSNTHIQPLYPMIDLTVWSDRCMPLNWIDQKNLSSGLLALLYSLLYAVGNSLQQSTALAEQQHGAIQDCKWEECNSLIGEHCRPH